MPFPEKVKEDALVACGRHCCICHKFCGTKIEIHHIVPHSKGGADSFDNAIPLCFDCHAEVGQYNSEHPKGTKFSYAELKRHRDNWYKTCAKGIMPKTKGNKCEGIVESSIPGFYSVDPPSFLMRVYSGQQLSGLLHNKLGMDFSYDTPQTKQVQNLIAECVQYITDYADFLDSDNISFLMECDARLTQYIKDLDSNEYWLFAATEILKAHPFDEASDTFPILHVCLKQKTSDEIVDVDEKIQGE